MTTPAGPLNNWFSAHQRFTHPSVVVVTGAILDKALEDLIIHKLGPFDEPMRQKLFNGPFYTSYNRALMAFALKLIDQTTFDSLQTYREIRNLFAHSDILLNFDTPKVDAKLRELGWKTGDKLTWWMQKITETVGVIESYKIP
jgi:hypothetical protein